MPELTRLRGGDDIARPADNNTPFNGCVAAALVAQYFTSKVYCMAIVFLCIVDRIYFTTR
jgi:hypothetical protein